MSTDRRLNGIRRRFARRDPATVHPGQTHIRMSHRYVERVDSDKVDRATHR